MIIAFPTEYEAGELVSRLAGKHRSTINGVPCYRGAISGKNVSVIISGMGAAMAARRVRGVLAQEPADTLILAGFAGALTVDLKKGQTFIVDETILHTTDDVVDTPEKKHALAQRTGCRLVDMETAAVSRVASAAKFLAIRAVSDEAHETVPVKILAHGYDQTKGVTTPLRMTFYLATHPWQLRKLMKFLSPLASVRHHLTDFIVSVIQNL
jgi:nucleoside phosphorylase